MRETPWIGLEPRSGRYTQKVHGAGLNAPFFTPRLSNGVIERTVAIGCLQHAYKYVHSDCKIIHSK